MFEYYKARLDLLTDYDSVENEIETMANDDSLTNDEYIALYEIAINKFRR